MFTNFLVFGKKCSILMLTQKRKELIQMDNLINQNQDIVFYNDEEGNLNVEVN